MAGDIPLEAKRMLQEAQARLDKREKEIADREQALIDNVTMQAITLVLLKALRKNGKLKPADLREIEFARTRFVGGEYDPLKLLRNILATTELDREDRRKAV